MVSHAAHTARTAIGIIGNVISFCLFVSPLPTFWKIWRQKSTEEFQPYPYIACLMNCLFWIFYGLPIVHPDSILVVTINGVGLVMELSYLIIFFIYSHRHRKYRKHIAAALVFEVILVGIVAALTLKFLHTHERRSMVVGIICVVFGVIMYSSPLSVMKQVIQTKSVEFMPFWLSVASFANGLTWTVYALLQLDIYILISNGLGVVAGLVQLILYACYYKGTPADDEKGAAGKQIVAQLDDRSPI